MASDDNNFGQNKIDYFAEAMAKAKELREQGKTIDAFLAEEYGITDVLTHKSNWDDKDISDFSFQRVHGNSRLAAGKVITPKEANAYIDGVIASHAKRMKRNPE